MTEAVTISFTLPPGAPPLSPRSSNDCNAATSDPPTSPFANQHQADEQSEAEEAIGELQRALAKAGFDPR